MNCWVCEGKGVIKEFESGNVRPCKACNGTGISLIKVKEKKQETKEE